MTRSRTRAVGRTKIEKIVLQIGTAALFHFQILESFIPICACLKMSRMQESPVYGFVSVRESALGSNFSPED